MIEHLKLIQGTIDRLGRNSFQLKAWTVILVSAIFALSENQAEPRYLWIGMLPVITFWGLDSYYLWQEKLFRALYDGVREDKHDQQIHGQFSMDTSPHSSYVETWFRVLLNRTIFGFYAPLAITVCLISLISPATPTSSS
jgi:hypothetical protein